MSESAEPNNNDVDESKIRKYRLERTKAQLAAHDLDAAVLLDPINIRYSTGSRNMQVWTSHNYVRYALVITNGPLVMFENAAAIHLLSGLELIDEARPAKSWEYFSSGNRIDEHVGMWADEIVNTVREYSGGHLRIGVDRADVPAILALQTRGVDVADAKQPLELARSIKSDEEVKAIRSAMRACTECVASMREIVRPGLRETDLFATLNMENIKRGGEHSETRLLNSGPRTNPWFQETTDRVIREGELLVFDTDFIGRYGIFADQTRAWIVGDKKPSDSQRRLYSLAREQLEYNIGLIKPGVTFKEMSEKSWNMPDIYVPNRYAEIVHGLGLAGEYPLVYYPQDAETWQYDGHFEENMVVCVESYIGEDQGAEGVKLEDPCLVTKDGVQRIESYLFEEDYH